MLPVPEIEKTSAKAPKAKTKTAEAPVEVSKGVVIYTDGGCRPSRGIGGWGIHGYTYNLLEEPPKVVKKIDAPTRVGYADDAEIKVVKTAPVSPIEYVDGWGSLIPESTNNIAELTAAINGIKVIDRVDAKEGVILSDSQYVISGVKDWSKKWIAQNWVKQDGTEVPNADVWKELLASLSDVEAKGRKVTWTWVKGHNNNLGNELADRNATRGVITGKKGQDLHQYEWNPSKGYWNPKVEYNRMFSHPRWYFTTNQTVTNQSKDGRFVYHCGQHSAKNEVLGKRVSDHAFSVLFMKEKEPVLESVREYQAEISQGLYSDIVIAYLDKLLSANLYYEIQTYGCSFIQQSTAQRDLYTTDDQLVTNECRPPRMAYVAIENLNILEQQLESFLADDDPNLIKTDITPYFYEQIEAKGKSSTKLKADIASSTKAVDVVGSYNTTGEPRTAKVTLTLAIDLPHRNALSALAERDPKVWLLTFKESEAGFRYCTVISAGDDIGIWSSIHSNLRIIALES